MRRFASRPSPLLLLWPALFMGAAFFAPFIAVVVRAAGVRGAGERGVLGELAGSAYYRGLLLFTVKQAALSTVFSAALGLPGAYLTGRCRFPGRRVLKSLTTVPFVLPPILAVLGFVLVFGNAGLINGLRRLAAGGDTAPWKMLYSLRAVVTAHVFFNFPLTLRIVGDAFALLPVNQERAAASLGAGGLRSFLAVDLPHLAPAILTASVLTFLYCFMSFAVVLVLGGGPKLTTLEVEIFRLIKYQLDFGRGSVLALAGSIIALFLLTSYAVSEGWFRRRLGGDALSPGRREPWAFGGFGRVLAAGFLGGALVLVGAPLGAVVVNSFIAFESRSAEASLSLIHWIRLFRPARTGVNVILPAIGRTALLALSVSLVTTITAALTAWYTLGSRRLGRAAEGVLALPLASSSVILGLGRLILLRYLPGGDAVRIAVLAAAHTVSALPFSYRIIAGRLRELSPRISQAARASGAGALQTLLRVELPLARRAIITSAVFALALSAGELSAAMVLAPGNFTTVPLAIYRLIGSYDFNGACALGTLLILLCLLAFLALDRLAEDTAAREPIIKRELSQS